MPKKQHSSSQKKIVQPHPPCNWPSLVRFLQAPVYHVSVPAAVRHHLEGTGTSKDNRIPRYNDAKVIIRRITDASHPAFGQFGLFAGQRIPPKMHIIHYLGEIHSDDRPDSSYDLSLCRLEGGINIGIDAYSMGNQARFVNDYRGIADKPNSVFIDGRINTGRLSMNICSGSQEIKKGQEILVSYGKSWWHSRRLGSTEEESQEAG